MAKLETQSTPYQTTRTGRLHAVGAVFLLLILVAGIWLAWHFRVEIAHPRTTLAPYIAEKGRAPLLFAAAFFAVDLGVTALAIPIEILLAVAAGALFGFAEGTVLVSFASTMGAALSFLASRFLLRRPVQKYLGRQLERVDRGVEREGAAYLFSLRLLPIFPFGLVNILMGVTSMRLKTFYLISQAGMLPALVLYVNAGTQLAHVDSLSGIVSPGMIAALVALGVFPWVVKAGFSVWRNKKGKTAHDRDEL